MLGDNTKRATLLLAGLVALSLISVPVLVVGSDGPTLLGGAEVDNDENKYESVVIFRNDDIQAWYRTEEMQAVNQVFIDEEIPVTLGIIPAGPDEEPITDDAETCQHLQYIEENHSAKFEMALHGYTHQQETDFHGASEFGGLPQEAQRERLLAAEEILTECVNSPSKTFIPPFDTYDNNTVDVLREEDYTAVSGGNTFTQSQYNETSYFKQGGILHIPQSQPIMDWDSYNETSDEVPLRDLDELIEAFDSAHENNELYVQMIHYQYFTSQESIETLQKLIQHMKSTDDVAFITMEEFATGINNGDIEETDEGWVID